MKELKLLVRKGISMVVIFTLLFTSFSLEVLANLNAQAEDDSEFGGPPILEEPIEWEDKRTEMSRTYINTDGSLTTEISQIPIHYQEEKTKKWKPIDNMLVLEGNGEQLTNKGNSFTARFKKQNKIGADLIEVIEGDASIALEPVQNEDNLPKGIMKEQKYTLTGKVQKNSITYPNIYPNVDVKYYMGSNKVKEDIIIKEKPTADTPIIYSYNLLL